jgi:hypothetical protein
MISKEQRRQIVADFLAQLAGELKAQALWLAAKPVPPKLTRGLARLQGRWGRLVPAHDAPGAASQSALPHRAGDEHLEELGEERAQQFDLAMQFASMLIDLRLKD